MNLSPLRRALRAETALDATRRRTDVTNRCARIVAEAEAEAARLATQGRLDGERVAEGEAARRRAAASRRARELRLQAERRQLEELRRRAREAALELRSDPGYPDLLERLSRTVRMQLGEDAELDVDPPGRGGVLGRRGNATVDYTLGAIAERVVNDLGTELAELWR